MKCPSCGAKGDHEGKAAPGEASFEFRGRLGGRVILRCMTCGDGVFQRVLPPGRDTIPSEQWQELDAFWQMRRAEILADLQAQQQFGVGDVPPDEVVAQSQEAFPPPTMNRSTLFHVLRQAGYVKAEAISALMRDDPIAFAQFALAARQRSVIHDSYNAILATGGAAQSPAAAARCASAARVLAAGDDAVRSFLADAAAGTP